MRNELTEVGNEMRLMRTEVTELRTEVGMGNLRAEVVVELARVNDKVANLMAMIPAFACRCPGSVLGNLLAQGQPNNENNNGAVANGAAANGAAADRAAADSGLDGVGPTGMNGAHRANGLNGLNFQQMLELLQHSSAASVDSTSEDVKPSAP